MLPLSGLCLFNANTILKVRAVQGACGFAGRCACIVSDWFGRCTQELGKQKLSYRIPQARLSLDGKPHKRLSSGTEVRRRHWVWLISWRVSLLFSILVQACVFEIIPGKHKPRYKST